MTISLSNGTMHVPVFKGEGVIEFEDRPVPAIKGSTDILVRVKLCGLCGTDLNILSIPPAHKATLNIILGHEATGTVEKTGEEVKELKEGDKVVIAPRITCSQCNYCVKGIENQCENYRTMGTTIDGALAPYAVAPEKNLFRISDRVSDDDSVFFEPLSCVVGSTVRAPLEAGGSVAVIGAGPIGLLFAQTYRALGAGKVIVCDNSDHRRAFAKNADVGTVLNANMDDLPEAVKEITGLGADLVVDAVGNQMATAIELARRAGQIILFGLRPHEETSISQYTITRNDLTVVGSFVGLNPFEKTIEFLEKGIVKPSEFISHRVGLLDLPEALTYMHSGEAVKVVVET